MKRLALLNINATITLCKLKFVVSHGWLVQVVLLFNLCLEGKLPIHLRLGASNSVETVGKKSRKQKKGSQEQVLCFVASFLIIIIFSLINDLLFVQNRALTKRFSKFFFGFDFRVSTVINRLHVM